MPQFSCERDECEDEQWRQQDQGERQNDHTNRSDNRTKRTKGKQHGELSNRKKGKWRVVLILVLAFLPASSFSSFFLLFSLLYLRSQGREQRVMRGLWAQRGWRQGLMDYRMLLLWLTETMMMRMIEPCCCGCCHCCSAGGTSQWRHSGSCQMEYYIK